MNPRSILHRALIHLIAALMGMALTTRAHAAVVSLSSPTSTIAAGSRLRVELQLLNPSNQSVAFTLPTNLDGRLTKEGQIWLVTLHGETRDISIPAGGFARLPMVLALPAEAFGRLVIEINQPATARAVIDVEPLSADLAHVAHPETAALSETTGAVPALPAASRLKRYYADHFSGHEPMYFVFGGEKPAAKFQFSLKYRVLNDSGPLAQRIPALKGLHVAYTQRSLWDITSNSSPFYDSSYMPEVLFESLATDTGKHEGFTWLGYQAAFQHESNGRAGADSRSMNIFYLRPMFVLGDPDGWRIIFRPKFLVYLGSLGDNRAMKDYRGYSELRLILGKNNRLSVSVTGRVGQHWDKGSAQVDVSYPTEFLTGNFAMYLLAQYWTGYGESLLHYDERSSTVRFGFSLAR